ncbi:unnamed protein product [Xylocopa violacea]|uniref:Uncharacterized protein n=1 Tax=Xylocopa violacea TaxID=135666 RepID=A0ABP1NEV9_XYLVO
MNNSLPSTSGQNSVFSGEKEGSWSIPGGTSVKVESTTPFDHVAAIKKITDQLAYERSTLKLPQETKSSVDDGVASTRPSSSHLNRNWSSKHSNRTKIRRPPGHHQKKNQNKVHSSKIHVNKSNSSKPDMNLKNWPNGAIQNADDFHNYDKYTSIGDDLKPDEAAQKPVPLKNSSLHYQVPISSPSLQEIVHWLKIPAFMTNGSHVIESEQIDGPISVAFDPVYQNLEPNKPSKPSTLQNLKPGFVYPLHSPSYDAEKIPNWLETVLLRNKTHGPLVYNPQTQVAQNTVVHLINTDLRKPNRTIVASKVPPGYVKPAVIGPLGSSSGSLSSSTSSKPGSYPSSLILTQLLPSSSTTSKPGPNVHIGFTSYEEENKLPEQQKPQSPVVTYDQSCPTILINSYTRINNTIQSKEGCKDLNIIINSHVFNTNVYKSTPSPLTGNTGSHQTYEEVDKYNPGSQIDTNPNLAYQPVPIYQTSSSGYPQLPQSGYYDPQKNPQSQILQQNDASSVEVIQDTQISISGSSSDESFLSAESTFAEDEEGEVANDGALALGSPGVGNDASVGNSLVRPAVAPAVSSTGSSGTSPAPPAGLIAGTTKPTRPSEDDNDDDYDLSPTGIMDSITSVFTYFTFVNPLHYGFFSLAAAPFTALAAGLLGIATFLFPWLFPSSLGFSRSNNSEESFWSNLEGVVRQAMDKYGRVNEWKSKRKKRKR